MVCNVNFLVAGTPALPRNQGLGGEDGASLLSQTNAQRCIVLHQSMYFYLLFHACLFLMQGECSAVDSSLGPFGRRDREVARLPRTWRLWRRWRISSSATRRCSQSPQKSMPSWTGAHPSAPTGIAPLLHESSGAHATSCRFGLLGKADLSSVEPALRATSDHASAAQRADEVSDFDSRHASVSAVYVYPCCCCRRQGCSPDHDPVRRHPPRREEMLAAAARREKPYVYVPKIGAAAEG